MDITSAQYEESTNDFNITVRSIRLILSNSESLSVPLDPANRHYAAILEWVAEGNTIQDAD
jgi:hypothetical protein